MKKYLTEQKSVSSYFYFYLQSVNELREDMIYVAPNNGNGYNQANKFFSIANISMNF